MTSTRSKTVFYLDDELGSYIKKTLSGNTKMIPVIRYPESIKPGMGTSFSLLVITKDLKAGQELVQSISDRAVEIDSPQKILKNNILFGEHAINEKIDYVQEIMNRFRNLLLSIETVRNDRKADQTREKIEALTKTFSGIKCYLTKKKTL